MLSHFKSFILITSFVITSVFSVNAQEVKTTENKTQEKTAKEEKNDVKTATEQTKTFTPSEQLAESTIYIYSGGLGKDVLKQIRKTAIERGKISVTNADGTLDQANYEKRVLRGESLDKEKIRVDQEFPTAKFALIYNDNKIVGVFNDSFFEPRTDASKAFHNQIWHGLEALLRYKENGATLAIGTPGKYMSIDYSTLEITDKNNRKTSFIISNKSFRVLWLEYTDDEIKYSRKFYDYRYAQGTLVPYRSVLMANGKQVEETTISTVTYGQKVTEDAFPTS